jgi:hypothetical protein
MSITYLYDCSQTHAFPGHLIFLGNSSEMKAFCSHLSGRIWGSLAATACRYIGEFSNMKKAAEIFTSATLGGAVFWFFNWLLKK